MHYSLRYKQISLLEEDDSWFPSWCVTYMFVCSPDLDIMLAFQHYGRSTVHGFPIADILIPLIVARKRWP